MRLAMPVYGKNARREFVTEFCGLNCTDMGGDGGGKSTFFDMLNGGTENYPFAASRLPRRVTQYDEATCALSGGEVLTRVLPPYLIYGDRQYDLGISPGEKQIVRMGTNILIFPDGKYFNTADGECGDIDEGETYSGAVSLKTIILSDGRSIKLKNETSATYDTFEVKFTRKDGYVYTSVKGSVSSAYDFYSERQVILEKHVTGNIILAYEDGVLYYIKSCDISVTTNEYGYPTATNIVWEELKVSSFEVEVSTEREELFKNTALWCGGQYVHTTESGIELMPGQNPSDIVSEIKRVSDGVFVYFNWKIRTLPIFDYITVCNNRLFGCRCGMPYDGSEPVNRLYASAPNDFKSFEKFEGISTDSWWGDVSEEGAFTAAWTYNGYPMFFKEDYVYILYGDYPPYSYKAVCLRGVAVGASKSLVELNGALYYKSRHDIMRYTSSSLSSISEALGNISDTERAVGGTYRDNYYISLDGEMYVFDSMNGLWAKEDSIEVIDFANVRGETYFLSNGGAVYQLNDGEERMPWSFTSPDIGYSYPNRLRLSSLQIRIEIGEGDELPTVELSLDGGAFKDCAARSVYRDGEGKSTGTIFIPILPGRCELFKYRVSGKGKYKLTGVTKILKECGK